MTEIIRTQESRDLMKAIKRDNKTKENRAGKGKCMISFPSDYVVVDLETTGFSPTYDDIIELCAIRVRNNEIVDCFVSLINRDEEICIDGFISELTGITQDMINSAPDIKDIFPKFLDFIGSDVIVGHNTNFDINFIYDRTMQIIGKPFTNDFIDTMMFSRRLYKNDRHHRLVDLAKRFSIDYSGSHRSKKDCEITKDCYDALYREVIASYGSENEFLKIKKQTASAICSHDTSTNITDFNKSHILYGKVCVLTGTLEKMTRKEAMQIICDLGGINANSITKKTNLLILGCNDYCKSIKDGKSNKQKKAEKMQLDGFDISIIPEDVFYEMINTE